MGLIRHGHLADFMFLDTPGYMNLCYFCKTVQVSFPIALLIPGSANTLYSLLGSSPNHTRFLYPENPTSSPRLLVMHSSSSYKKSPV